MKRLEGRIFAPYRNLWGRLAILKDEVFPRYESFSIDPVFGGADAIYVFFLFGFLALGVVNVYSSSYQYAAIVLRNSEFFLTRQLVALAVGLVAFWFALRFNVGLLGRRWFANAIFVAAFLMCTVATVGHKLHLGFVDYRWIKLGPMRFQPSEFARVAVVLFLAHYLSERRELVNNIRGYVPALALAGLLAAPLMIQPHVSGAAMVLILALVMLWVAGLSWWKVAVPAGVLGAAGLIYAKEKIPYAMSRIKALADLFLLRVDWTDQVPRSMEAFSSGGLWGKGLGEGLLKFGYLSEIHTDFIYAHLAEEQGLILAVAIPVVFLLVLRWSIRLSDSFRDSHRSLLAFGLGVALVLPAFLNMLVALGMFFPTGVPFPFLSYGGSALMMNLFVFGLLLNLSARAFEETLERPVRWVIAGGGTGGHVVPGIALAQRITERWPKDYVVFVGVGSAVERRLLAGLGFEARTVRAWPVVGRRGLGFVWAALKNLVAAFGAMGLLARIRPDRVIGVGGYASVPVVVAAWLMRIPRVIFEPDATGGRANRLLARIAGMVFVAFESAARNYPPNKTQVVGPLIRREFFTARGSPGDKPAEFVLLLIGGSQGSRALVKALTDALPKLAEFRDKLFVYCQAREEDEAAVRERLRDSGVRGEVRTFFAEVWNLYAQADLVVSRAGANAIYELMAVRKPAILIPYPHALGHQEKNARRLVDAGAAEMVRDDELNGELLAERIAFYIQHPERLREMAVAYRGMKVEDGAERLVEMVRGR